MTTLKTIACVFCATLFSFSLGAQEAKKGIVKLELIAEKEVVVVNDKGEKRTKRVEATKALPGEMVHYTIIYRNDGREKADNVVIKNPIPSAMIYRDGSALGENTVITYSVDHGKSFADSENLELAQEDGTVRVATPKEYNAIQWKLTKSVRPGESGSVAYSAVLK